jgi:hypothetical protein
MGMDRGKSPIMSRLARGTADRNLWYWASHEFFVLSAPPWLLSPAKGAGMEKETRFPLKPLKRSGETRERMLGVRKVAGFALFRQRLL